MRSNYVTISTMSFTDFANAPVNTEASFLLTTDSNSRAVVSKSLKAYCSKARSVCVIVTQDVLIKQPNGVWLESHILTARIVSGTGGKKGDNDESI